VRVLVDTAEVMAVLSVMDGEALTPGSAHFIQLRTDTPLVAMPNDRFILRRESPLETLGGGVFLDPWAPRVRKRQHDQAIEQLEALMAGDRSVLLLRAGEGGLTTEQAERYAVPATDAIALGERLFHPSQVDEMRGALMSMLTAWHEENPLQPGAPRRDLRRERLQRLPESVFVGLVEQLAESGKIVLEGPRLRSADFQIVLTAAQQTAQDAMRAALKSAGLKGPKTSDLMQRDAALLHLLLNAGEAAQVGPYVLHTDSLVSLKKTVTRWLAENGGMLPTDFKNITGLSRKYAIPLLEWLDSEQVTRREGDRRVAGGTS